MKIKLTPADLYRFALTTFFCLSLSSLPFPLLGQLRLNVAGSARITGSVIELVKPANTGHILNLSSDGAAMDINATTDLYLNSGGNILLDANSLDAKVGIGTAGPQVKFHIVGDRFRLATPGDENRYIDLRTDGTALDLSPVGADLLIDPGNNNLILATQNGRVGIGTGAPDRKLSVLGDTRIEGKLELFKAVGDSSLFMGLNAGINDQGQTANTIIGTNAGKNMVSAEQNTILGYDAGLANIAGDRNVYIGYHSARNTGVISGRNVFVGDSTGVFNESHENVFIGSNAGKLNVSGYGNTFIGYLSGTLNDSGYGNTFSGRFAGGQNSTGFYNVFMGAAAGHENSAGHSNTFLGLSAGYNNTSGTQNTFVGRSAGSHNIKGTRNTYIGNETGTLIDSLDRAIAIGYAARVECHNCAAIGGEGEHAVMVGIGTAAPEKTLDVVGEAIIRDENKLASFHSTGANAFFSFENNGGTAGADIGYFNDTNDEYFFINTPGGAFGELAINGPRVGVGLLDPAYQLQLSTNSAAKPSSSTWTVASDKRLKKNIRPFTDGLAVLQQIDPVWYRYNGKAGLHGSEQSVGVIAQQMQRIAPYTVGTFKSEKKQYLSFDANALFYIIINAVKEQQRSIVERDEQLEAQAREMQTLRTELDALKEQMQRLVDSKTTGPGRQELELSQKPFLSQNQPNPFHRESLIRYIIPRQVEDAWLQLRGMDGRLIKQLRLPNTGSGEIVIKANQFPAGTYLYTLVLDGRPVDTKKLVLTE